jgi:diguanylate cyclase (GGDEF)-like protein
MVDVREMLVPVVSAGLGAGLTLALLDVHSVLAAVAGTLAGAVTGALIHRSAHASTMQPDSRDARIAELEAMLAAEQAASASFRRDVEERERFMGDLEMSATVMEEQASHSVELAEELAEQKMALELSKQRSDYLANHDLLTGLPNRRAFQEELRNRVEQAADTDRAVALLFIDLDKFKEVNDTLGHDAGDDLLKTVASLLDAAMRENDIAARLGGDEFAIIVDLPRSTGAKSAANLAERVRLSLQIPTPSPKGDIAVGATIGVALYPEDAEDAPSLLHAADQVMYAGKRRGRNRVVTTAEMTPEDMQLKRD